MTLIDKAETQSAVRAYLVHESSEIALNVEQIIAALPARGVGVKPLIFSEFKEGGCMGRPHPFQYFITQAHNGRFLCHHDETWHETLEAAQAHAQVAYQSAALAAAYPADLAEAGKALGDLRSPASPYNHLSKPVQYNLAVPVNLGKLGDAIDLITALIARIAAQEAQMKADGERAADLMIQHMRRAEAAETALAAMTKERDSLKAEVQRWAEKLEGADGLWTEAETALAAERAKVAKLVEAADWQEKQRRDAFARRHLNAPEDAHVAVLCERYGYGAVMDAASRLWARQDSMGAFYIGGCIGISPDAAITEAGQ